LLREQEKLIAGALTESPAIERSSMMFFDQLREAQRRKISQD
jgi:hypothetical protein